MVISPLQDCWWTKRTVMERRLVVLTGLMFLLSLSLSAVMALSDQRSVLGQAGQDKYCFSKECVTAAADILNRMNSSADPCQDFYNFACGGFIENTLIPDDKSRTSMFSELSDQLNEKVRALLEGDIKATDPKPFQMVKSVFQSCMNREVIEQRGLDPVKSILTKLGGWPLLEGSKWNSSEFQWFELVYKFREQGFSVDYFFDFSVVSDLKNSTWRTLDLDQPGLLMSREYLMKGLEDSDVQAYFTYMKDISLLMGATPENTELEMLDVLKFEIEIANITLPREERRDATKLYNPMKISDLKTLDPSTPWLKYINTILGKEIEQVTEEETIIVGAPSFIENMSKLIAATPARVQANYLLWRVVASTMSYMTEEVEKVGLKFAKKLTGQSAKPPRWKKCVGAATGSLSSAVGSLYVSRHFDEASKSTALDMVNDIKKQFDIILDEIDWMDDGTKLKAKAKAAAMVEHIGYPSELLDMKKLTELYDGLELGPDDFLGNGLNLTVFATNYSFGKLREKVNKTDWVRHGNPAVVNAFYSPLENSIQFPAGILQGVFFNSQRPKYMNYGAIGWVIGHEITHGFDDQGRQFDKEGNLLNWWQPDTSSRYLKKAKCIIDQYRNYTFPQLDNLPLNGINTQGENIADNGGIKEAYRAYNEWVNTHGEEQLLPGLNFTPRQMFWISAANVWCSKSRPQALKLSVLTGTHSPDQFRVQGAFSNMEAFSKDFKCPAGSKMNPEKNLKCKVW